MTTSVIMTLKIGADLYLKRTQCVQDPVLFEMNLLHTFIIPHRPKWRRVQQK